MSSEVSTATGASSSSKKRLCTCSATAAAMPWLRAASSTISRAPVLASEAPMAA